MFSKVCFCRGSVVRAPNTQPNVFEKNVLKKTVVEFALFTYFVDFWNLTRLHKGATLNLFVWRTDLWWEKSIDLIARTNIRVQHLKSCKNLSFNPYRKFSVLPEKKKRLNRDTKLIAILRRQFCIILTALEENIFSVLGSVASRLLPTSRQYNAELPSQNRY